MPRVTAKETKTSKQQTTKKENKKISSVDTSDISRDHSGRCGCEVIHSNPHTFISDTRGPLKGRRTRHTPSLPWMGGPFNHAGQDKNGYSFLSSCPRIRVTTVEQRTNEVTVRLGRSSALLSTMQRMKFAKYQ